MSAFQVIDYPYRRPYSPQIAWLPYSLRDRLLYFIELPKLATAKENVSTPPPKERIKMTLG